MILAGPFALNNKYTDKMGELILKYNNKRNSFEKLIEFAEEYQDHRLVIMFDSVDASLMRTLQRIHPHVSCKLTRQQLREHAAELRDSRVSFFTQDPVDNFVLFQDLLAVGVCAIYPAGDLLYKLPQIQEWTEVRIILNHMQSSAIESQPEKGMFFAPQAFERYKNYIDVVEFDCGSPYNWDKFGVYYRAWFEKQHWRGNLQEIITGLNVPIPGNSYIQSEIIDYKMRCGRKCAYDMNCRCHKCKLLLDTAFTLMNNNIGVRADESESFESSDFDI